MRDVRNACTLRLIATTGLILAAAGAVAQTTEKPRSRTIPGMQVTRDQQYGDIGGADPNLTSLEIYALRTSKNLPVLVFIHGGGWWAGDKNRGPIFCDVGKQSVSVRTSDDKTDTILKAIYFTGQGFVFVSTNYRLSPQVKHPTHVQDVAQAIAWVYKNISKYGGDPNRIFVMGHSAGAHLAALVATDGRHLEQSGASLDVLKGAILLDGAGYDIPRQMRQAGPRLERTYRTAFGEDPKDWKDASPITHIAKNKNIPPFLIVHAGERLASKTQAEWLARKLQAADVPARTFHARDKNHMTLNRHLGRPNDDTTLRIATFLRKHTSK